MRFSDNLSWIKGKHTMKFAPTSGVYAYRIWKASAAPTTSALQSRLPVPA